jgi:tetratricopeptide (TPR) repeat protein
MNLELNPERKKLFKKFIFIFPIIALSCFILLKFRFNELYLGLMVEDGLVEYTQSLFYLISSIVACLIMINFFKTRHHFYGLIYLVLSMGLLLCFVEEISWGQRILEIDTPEYFNKFNLQQEINLHNLDTTTNYLLEFYILTGFFGAFAWLLIPNKIKSNHHTTLKYFVPDWFIAVYFFPIFIVYFYYVYLAEILGNWYGIDFFLLGNFIAWGDQEVPELLLSSGFLVFVLINKYRQNTNQGYVKHINFRAMLAVSLGTFFVLGMVHFIHVAVTTRIFPYHHARLGDNFLKRGSLDEAIRHYNEALRIEPNYPNIQNNLANALASQGRMAEAIHHYSEALRIRPNSAQTHNNLGNALAEQGRGAEAIHHYSEALRLDPNYVEAHNNLGNALANQGRTAEAIRHYSEALRIKPNSAQTHNNLGIALLSKGNANDAIAHFREALQIRPKFESAQENLKTVLAAQGEIEGAIARIQEAQKRNPEDPALYYKLGYLYQRKGELDEAIAQYQKALSIQPGFTRAINNLASVYASKGEYDKAISLLKKGIRLKPDGAGAYYNIACLYARQNKIEESIDWLKKAVERGYNKWDLIKSDKDLENIRGTSYYKEITKGH